MPVVVAIIDLHFDAFIDGIVLVLRLDRNADKDAGIAFVIRHLIDNLDGCVPDLLFGVPQQPLAGGGFEQAVLDRESGERSGALIAADCFPAIQVFSVEQVHRKYNKCQNHHV
jgi:hypothetical protein